MTRKSRDRSPAPAEASPAKSLARELRGLRKELRVVGRHYLQRIEAELVEVLEAVTQFETASTDLPTARIRDLRDMLMLIRSLQLKPDKGRRKDLKKIDAAVGDLRLFLDRW